MEKLYTVEDIANMTSLTTRTIRNYIKDGILKGRKIGGQWRFTEEDVKNLMNSGTYGEDITDSIRQEVIDFLDNVTNYTDTDIQVCTIIDLYQDKSVIEEKAKRFNEYWKSNNQNLHMSYAWEHSEEKVRVTLFTPPHFLIELLKILQ